MMDRHFRLVLVTYPSQPSNAIGNKTTAPVGQGVSVSLFLNLWDKLIAHFSLLQ